MKISINENKKTETKQTKTNQNKTKGTKTKKKSCLKSMNERVLFTFRCLRQSILTYKITAYLQLTSVTLSI